jgi:putative flippase GtrA
MKLFSKTVKKQMVGFVITGLLSTMIMFSTYVILCKLLNYQYAYLIAYSVSVVFLYFMNTFLFKKPILLETFLKFPLIYLLQYFVSAASLELLVEIGFSVTFAPLLVIIVLFPVTFLLNRIVFSKH